MAGITDRYLKPVYVYIWLIEIDRATEREPASGQPCAVWPRVHVLTC